MDEHTYRPPPDEPPAEHEPWSSERDAPLIGETGTPSQPQGGVGMLLRKVLGPLIFLAFVGFKWLKIGFVLLKSFKFAGTAISMVVSIGAYAVLWGLPFAIGFVALMFVHELGHAYQMRREGIATSPIVFVPFLGAVIAMKDMPRNAWVEAKVALAGPVIGSLGALVVYWAALEYDSEFLSALAFTGFFLNLFNLVPLSPLDGGRIAAALSPALWFGGMALMIGLVFLMPNPILILIVVLGVLESWGRWKSRNDNTAYYRSVTPSQRTKLALSYAGLAIALVVLMDLSFIDMG